MATTLRTSSRPATSSRSRFELYPTSNVFKAGHRIAVEISSSNYPRFDVNPNTGEPLGRQTHTRIALNTVHHNAERASRVELSVVPR